MLPILFTNHSLTGKLLRFSYICTKFQPISIKGSERRKSYQDNFLYYSTNSKQNASNYTKHYKTFVFLGALGASGLYLWYLKDNIIKLLPNVELKDTKKPSQNGHRSSEGKRNYYGEIIDGLPTYTSKQISSHDNLDKRIWVSYKKGVYDITDFIPKHPGGDKILMGSGSRIDVFWDLFPIHKTVQVLDMLEEYRIGNLSPEEFLQESDSTDPFSSDPKRNALLKPSSLKPFNAEPPNDLLIANFITPNELFFVRNHLPVPVVEESSYELEIEGLGIKPITLTLQDLKTKFQKHTITSTIQCAGNRRSELNKIKEVKGLNWGTAAISTAVWSGVKLIDVLRYAGVKFDDPRIQHIQFEGLDTDPASFPYGASIPAQKGLDPNSDVLLAYEMNGEMLPRDHGYPLRVIVPGVVGARNVKWLKKIEVSHEESKSHWQQNDYKGFSPNINWDNVDFKSAPAIQEPPVTSVICEPSNGNNIKLKNGKIPISGYAWSGGGRKIIRVDVSTDSGQSWHTANLEQDSSPLYKAWTWTLWNIEIDVPERKREIHVICKAVDAAYNVQPDTFAPIWNLRGVLANAWHKITVNVS